MQWSAEDRQNVTVGTHAEIKEHLRSAFFPAYPERLEYPEQLIHTPLLILGPVGCGKTEAITSFAKENGLGFKEIRLSNHDVTDLMGLPTVHREVNDNGEVTDIYAEWVRCGCLPSEKDPDFKEKGILFLDEITNADKAVGKAAWQLADASRKVGGYKLPMGWMVVLAGNGPRDGGAYVALESAVFTRCVSFRLEPDVQGWERWAIGSGYMDPAVIGFIKHDNNALWGGELSFEQLEDGCVFPTPRSWALCSRQLRAMGDHLDYNVVERIASHTVGQPTASQFASFYTFKEQMADIEGMFNGTTPIEEEQFKSVAREVLYIQNADIAQRLYRAIKDDAEADYRNDEAYKTAARGLQVVAIIGRVALDAATAALATVTQVFEDNKNLDIFSKFIVHRMNEIATDAPDFNKFYSTNRKVLS